MVKLMTLNLIFPKTLNYKLISELTKHVIPVLPLERHDTVCVPIRGRENPGF